MWFVYIIYSERLNYYYKGSTQDVWRRLTDHNTGRNKSTANKGPWKLVFVRSFATKQEAELEERRLKRTNTNYLLLLITQDFNELKNLSLECNYPVPPRLSRGGSSPVRSARNPGNSGIFLLHV